MIPELSLLLSMIFGYFVFRKKPVFLNLFNPAFLFYLTHVILFGIGGLYRKLYSDIVPVSDVVVYIASFSLLFFLLGVYFSFYALQNICRKSIKECFLDLYSVKSITLSSSSFFNVIVFLVPFIFFAVFNYKVGGLLWLMDNMDDARMELRKGLGAITLLGISSTFVCSLVILNNCRPRFPAAILIIFIFSFLAALYGNRAPAGFVFVSSFYYYYSVVRGRQKYFILSLVFLALFVLLMSLNIIRQGLDFSYNMVVLQTLWRPFVNFQNLNIIYENFYLAGQLQYGLGFLRDFSIFMPGISQNNAEWLKEYLGMEFTGGGITITYLGDIIVNFHLIFAFIFSFLYGFVLNALFAFMVRLKLSLVFILIVSFSLMAIVSSGLIPPLINLLAPYFIIYFSIAFARLFLSSILSRNGQSIG